MNLIKRPELKALNPFTGEVCRVRVLSWDRARRVAHVVDGGLRRRTIPFSYFCWVACGSKLVA